VTEAAVRSPVQSRVDSSDRISIRRLDKLEEFQEACVIQEETWGAGFSERVPAAILNVSQRIGGVTAGAFAPNGRMIGFVFGMTGVRDGRLVHWSDMLAVRPEARGHHLGDRLKHFQRECVAEIGVDVILWTFDPLVARNAHFNINRLGARAAEYVANMYGDNTGSAIHGTVPTDRFIAEWRLRNARPLAAEHLDPPLTHPDAPIVNPTDANGIPALRDLPDAPAVLVAIPHDIQSLGERRPELRTAWREASRRALLHYLGHGYDVTGFRRGVDGRLPVYELTKRTN
jgi:predicted GNAT superfamily acetyltransferase